MTEPEPDHMCVFICDLKHSDKCFDRSVPMAYGLRESKGWFVLPAGFVVCALCYKEFS